MNEIEKRLRDWCDDPANDDASVAAERQLMREAADEIKILRETLVLVEHSTELVLVAPEQFEFFWQRYPKRNGAKVGKANAKKQWAKLKPDERSAACFGLELYAVAKGGYPEDAERYLRHRRWVGLEVDTPGDRDARIIAKSEQMAAEWGMK